ncbi:DNA replication/repair protein RecF [Actinomyces sp. zg-332]|uniref:DNA replication/repair protein RecF n=1 Tax=Actinomyces sp. zg-332 TaxID=2708340 RepID=UPI001424A59C|nr:DNA replication/repair protein RecF [Actinomyces sp. zg-332]QPK94149.1 DNA replication/repair protein RecF [Actinomyces sp. zg-332]
MYISDLALNDYRSYKELVISFTKGINILVGENGQGKTNLVEAIGYLSTFTSHRVKNDNTLIRYILEEKHSAPGAIIRARNINKNHNILIELELIQGKPNRARINKNNVKNKEILGHIKTVIFAPEDLQIIRSEPNIRRNFLDELITQIYPTYMGIRNEIEKVLKQRAAVLKLMQINMKKGIKTDQTMVQIWDEKLAELCAKSLKERIKIINRLSEPLKKSYNKVTNENKTLTIAYKNCLEKYNIEIKDPEDISLTKKQYLQAFEENKQIEIERGINLIGVHRDDIEFFLNDIPVKGYASHGETWSVVLSLKVASYEIIKEIFEEDPILILDDVFAELDTNRRNSLIKLIKNTEQVFITAAVNEDVPEELEAKKYYVKNIDGITKIFDNPHIESEENE